MLNFLKHYGVKRKSGRYPWGSGDRPFRHEDWLRDVHSMKKRGMSDKDIAESFGINTKQLRARIHIANNEVKKEKAAKIQQMRREGKTWTEIAKDLDLKNESTARSLVNQDSIDRRALTDITVNTLKSNVNSQQYLDVGRGAEIELGVKGTRLDNALAILVEEGYQVISVQVPQMGTSYKTTIRTLVPPGTTYKDIVTHPERIKAINNYEELNTGNAVTNLNLQYFPKQVSSKRIEINYADQGGKDKDGVIEVRRGVEEFDMGQSQYAQVRINVDGTHYMKGMAIYSDDLPPGVDVRYNTNKKSGTPAEKVFKPMKVSVDDAHITKANGEPVETVDDLKALGWTKAEIKKVIDKDNPFGASIVRQTGAMNIINEEGDWGVWSKTLASQFLSKQPETLAKRQLDLSYANKKAEYDEIVALNNPVIKRKLLESFSDDCDASAVSLKAAALPRQASKVILPVSELKEKEIYAPTFNHGEEVILIRYPHGGTFEIPKLRVNNKNKAADSIMHNAVDAVGINPKTAEVLSGADFDGDSVIVIPTKNINVRTSDPLAGLKDFDMSVYTLPDDKPAITNRKKQIQMGVTTNLITDMTLKGAPPEDIVKAVKHSMVVIDAEKHRYDIKKSEKDNDIDALKKEYQDGGASTIISRAKNPEWVNKRKISTGVNSMNTDKETGERIHREEAPYVDKKTGELRYNKQESTKMAETKDAYTLTSGGSKENPGTRMEGLYAQYANDLKALANAARKEALVTPGLEYSPSARSLYSDEVTSLDHKLNVAKKNAPRERQAQLLANQIYNAKTEGRNLDQETKSKIRGQALNAARTRLGAKKILIDITDKEWEAIQAGAITTSKLKDIIDNTDLDALKVRATPRAGNSLSQSQINRIKAYSNSGYSLSEIAKAVGVSTSTVSNILKPKD